MWLQTLSEIIQRIWWSVMPFAVVDFNERAIRVRLGRVIEELGPGFHWRRLFVEKIEKVSAAEDFIDLPFGDVPSKDGKTITFSANVGYRIVSPNKLWNSVTDPDQNLSRLALGKLATLVSRKNADELALGQKAVRTWLKRELTRETEAWGIEITRVFITNWVEAKQLRLIGEATTLL
jgi:regulator of protease activity HflC (stomatin/prohibitin superfamily)